MLNMKYNNIPWADPVLASTSLSRRQESKQAQRLHAVPLRHGVCRHEEFTMSGGLSWRPRVPLRTPATKMFCVGHMLRQGTADMAHPVNCRYLTIFLFPHSQLQR